MPAPLRRGFCIVHDDAPPLYCHTRLADTANLPMVGLSEMSGNNRIKIDIEGEVTPSLRAAAREAQGEIDKLKNSATGAAEGMGVALTASRALAFGMGAVTAVGAVGVAAWGAYQAVLVAAAVQVKDTADELGKLSQRTGLSVEKLSELRYAASLSNASLDDMTRGLKHLADQMQSALAGNAKAAVMFDSMGISLKDNAGRVKGLDHVLAEVADRISGYANGATKMALANDLLGRGVGEKLIPLLNGGGEGFRQMAVEAKKLGVVYDDKLARQSAELNDNLMRLRSAGEGAALALGRNMVPALVDITYWMTESAKKGRLLEAVLLGLGAATVKLFGGEINPLKVVERDAASAFTIDPAR